MLNYIDQGALAEKAFAEYEFGDGVMVTDTSGWEYTTPGHERTRKVYVETAREHDGPAPRWVLNFTVRFDSASGALSEAYAMDEKGQIWGNMASQREVTKLSNLGNSALEVLVDIARTIGAQGLTSNEDSREDWHLMCRWAEEFQQEFDSKPDAAETYFEDVEEFAIHKATEAGWTACNAISIAVA